MSLGRPLTYTHRFLALSSQSSPRFLFFFFFFFFFSSCRHVSDQSAQHSELSTEEFTTRRHHERPTSSFSSLPPPSPASPFFAFAKVAARFCSSPFSLPPSSSSDSYPVSTHAPRQRPTRALDAASPHRTHRSLPPPSPGCAG